MSSRPKKTGSKWQRPAPRKPRLVDQAELARAASPFYSYPASLLAEWCCVSIDVAASWKEGTKHPSAAEMKLFLLYSREQVLDSLWWKGWILRRGVLVDPEGNECRQALLRAYPMIVQLCRRLAYESGSREASSMIDRLLAVA